MGWWRRTSLRRRVMVAAALATAGVAVVLSVLTVGVAAFVLRDQVDDDLRQAASQLARDLEGRRVVLGATPEISDDPDDGYDPEEFDDRDDPGDRGGRGGPDGGWPGLPRSRRDRFGFDGPFSQFRGASVLSRVFDSSGRTEAASPLADLPLSRGDLAVAAGTRIERFTDLEDGDLHLRTLTVPLPGRSGIDGDGGLALQVARPVGDVDRALVVLAVVGIGTSGFGLVVAAVVAWLVARSALRPVDTFTGTVEHVARTGDLSVTVPAEGDTELGRLGRAFNGLMSSLATSRAQQRQLIADAGHELRTPLTSIRTNLELLAEEGPAAVPLDERQELLADVNAQFEELSTLVADVVALARDEEVAEPERAEVRLDRVVSRAVERARRRANGIVVECSVAPAVLDGQAALLERAVLNVVDNAVKWSPTGGTVRVRQEGGTVEVDDEGPGIEPADRPHVFERFWRSPSARAVPGSGLGLAIVAQVMAGHGGTATVGDAPGGGTRVTLEVPATPVER